MPHPLELSIASLRRRARLLLWVHGAASVVALVAATVAVLCLGDYLIRYEERGIRLASSLAALAVVGWAYFRFIRPVVTARLSDVFLARRIEKAYPVLRERLSGAVAFLSQSDDDVHAGSPTLRRTVIHETTQDAMRVPVGVVLRPQPAYMAAAVAVLVSTAVVGLAFTYRDSAETALARLLRPWADDAWPQTNHLEVLDPVRRLALGHRFHAEVVDKHGENVAGDVFLEYRLNGEKGPVESVAMLLEGGRWSSDRERLTRDFSYRAVGGDDRSMPWIDVQVVEPPTLGEVRWKAHYPKYCDWAPLDTGLQPADRRPLASAVLPLGTQLEVWGRVNKPLKKAGLKTDSGALLVAEIDADRLGFSLSLDAGKAWKPERREAFQFELVGDDGIAGGEPTRQEVLVEPDPAPWAKLDEPRGTPESPRGDIYVTPTATVEVAISAGDVFPVRPKTALADISLRYGRSDKSSDQDAAESLYRGPHPLAPPAAAAPSGLKDEETRSVKYSFELAPLSLPPGTFVNLYGTARDYQGQERLSEARRLRVVAPDVFVERLNERQRALHADLNKLLEKQANAEKRTAEAAGKARDGKSPAEAIRDTVTQALDLQRQVEAGLGMARNEREPPRPDGVRSRTARMLADLRSNKIDNREIESRLSALDEALAGAERDGAAQQATEALSEARKNDPADDEQRKRTGEALDKAGEKQKQVQDALTEMLRHLSQWDDYGKFHEELNRIRQDQERLAGETLEHLQRERRGQDDLKGTAKKSGELAEKQAELSRRFDALKQQMRRGRDSGDAQGAEALERALEAADRENPDEAMRQAGQMLEQNRSGGVADKQQEAIEKLGRVMQALSASKADDLNRLVAKLREAEKELEKLNEEQKGLKKKLDDAKKQADPKKRDEELKRLAREQRELQRKTQEMAEKLRRLQARRAAEQLDKGGARMSAAGGRAEQNDGDAAAEQAEAAERDLEEAQQRLAEERRQAEADLAREVAAKMADQWKAALIRQQRIIDETKRYEGLKQTGPLSRAALVGLLDLAKEQETLADETTDSAERLASAAAFKLALDGAVAEMTRAARMLRERRTDEPVVRAETNAIRRFQQMIDAFAPRKSKGGGQQGGNEGGGNNGGGQSGGEEGIRDIAELVLVKLMQEDVNARTKELDAAGKNGALTPEQREEFQRLGEEQGKLADLLLEMIGETEAEGESEKSPDLKPEDLKTESTREPSAGRESPPKSARGDE
jgi:hypothetical protein